MPLDHRRHRAAPAFFVAAIMVAVAATSVVAAADAPRYRLHAGQHLVYEGDEVATTTGGSIGVERRTDLHVVRSNDDGSWTLFVQQRQIRFTDRGGTRTDQPPRIDTYVVRLFPDGRVTDRATVDSFGVIDRILPALPPSGDSGPGRWSYGGADVTYACTARPADAKATFAFDVVPASTLWTLQGFSAAFTYRLDPARGVIVSLDGRHRVKGRDTRKARERLVAEDTLTPAQVAGLAAQIDDVVAAEKSYRAAVSDAVSVGDRAGRERLASAVARLEHVREQVTAELLATHLDRIIAGHRASSAGLESRMARAAQLVGRPAPDWTLTDLDGRTHALADYRGRVVVLDFWYRACGWCIRAMPQLAALAERMQGRPVAVLGMNVDRDQADARLVVDLVKMPYPTLRGDRELAGRHGVRGYPTLVVIDGAGVVRFVHTGYSPTLVDELERVIDRLTER